MLNFRTRRRLDAASAYNFNSNDNTAIQFKKVWNNNQGKDND